MGHFGISQKMVTDRASISSKDITQHELAGSLAVSLSGPENVASCELMQQTHFSFGDTSASDSITKRVLTVRSPETKARIGPPSSFSKRTRSLISSGLIAGTTPLLIRKQSGAKIRDIVLLPLDGVDVVGQRKDCISSTELYERVALASSRETKG